MVCGSSLEYLDQTLEMTCTCCQKTGYGHIRCPNGHYLCEECHNKDSLKVIEEIAFGTKFKDPIELTKCDPQNGTDSR